MPSRLAKPERERLKASTKADVRAMLGGNEPEYHTFVLPKRVLGS